MTNCSANVGGNVEKTKKKQQQPLKRAGKLKYNMMFHLKIIQMLGSATHTLFRATSKLFQYALHNC